MRKIPFEKTLKKTGKTVKVSGWVHSIREHKNLVFLDLRDEKDLILQVVLEKNLAERINLEDVIEVEGKVLKRPEGMVNPKIETGEIEIKGEKIRILSEAKTLPFDLRNLNLSLLEYLNWFPVVLKNEKVKAIFKIQQKIVEGFRENLKKLGFFEFQSPILCALSVEGGAEVFKVDYFSKEAFLVQSPQLYKQILVSSFGKVFCVAKAFRAEPSLTSRHLCEFTSLDCEVGFIETLEELLSVCEKILKGIFKKLEKEAKKELNLLKVELPKIPKKIPRIKLFEAGKTIFNQENLDDLDPEKEQKIFQFFKERENSDFVFVTHFPTLKRPFYTLPDPKNPEYSLSFDLLFDGLEIVSGSLRIHKFEDLLDSLKKRNLDPKNFQYYLLAFEYGMPPHGGFGLGLERITKQMLKLKNIREATLFVRDLKRVDLPLREEEKENEKD
jgi:nondiscriminating aspartyl-tRNA synthetase